MGELATETLAGLARVDPAYLRGVLRNVERCARDVNLDLADLDLAYDVLVVRFGTVGTGVTPNYQVTTVVGVGGLEVTRRFHGGSHREFRRRPDQGFVDTSLSDGLGYEDLRTLLDRRLCRSYPQWGLPADARVGGRAGC
jgi:hypothetical protein